MRGRLGNSKLNSAFRSAPGPPRATAIRISSFLAMTPHIRSLNSRSYRGENAKSVGRRTAAILAFRAADAQRARAPGQPSNCSIPAHLERPNAGALLEHSPAPAAAVSRRVAACSGRIRPSRQVDLPARERPLMIHAAKGTAACSFTTPCRRALAGLAVALMVSTMARAQAPVEEAVFEAAYLHKFPGFVDWPADAFKTPASPIVIGVAGAPGCSTNSPRSLAGGWCWVGRWRYAPSSRPTRCTTSTSCSSARAPTPG